MTQAFVFSSTADIYNKLNTDAENCLMLGQACPISKM